MDELKRQGEDESQVEFCREEDITMKAEVVKYIFGTVDKLMNDAEDIISDAEKKFRGEKHQTIFEQLQQKMVTGNTR